MVDMVGYGGGVEEERWCRGGIGGRLDKFESFDIAELGGE
jgi:hypothetical protein